MRLTNKNANEYNGKTLDAEKKLFYYYPIRVKQLDNGEFRIVDRTKTMMRIPDEGIRFDTVIAQGGGDGG